MGWGSNNKKKAKGSGYKFAHVVKPGDIVLIARSHQNQPQIFGFGVVKGDFQTALKGVPLPYKPGSIRRLSPFLPRSRAPKSMPLGFVLTWTRALAELHPKNKSAHKKLCDWLELALKRDAAWRNGKGPTGPTSKKSPERKGQPVVKVIPPGPPGTFQEDYEVRTPRRVKIAKKREAALVARYARWLKRQGRTLSTVLYKQLRCDGYETARRNLIEAKSSASREHLRMAVGQLLDYAYQGKKKLGEPHKAILVPTKPARDLIDWLASLGVHLVWPARTEFVDSANGQFT